MKRLIALCVSVGLLAVIVASVDRAALWENLKATRGGPFALALAFFIPQNALMAWRWRMMARNFIAMPWPEAIRLILAAQTLNIVLPSKMGDLSKAIFLKRSGAMDLSRATNLVVFEKMLDVAALCLLAVLGAIVANAAGVETTDRAIFGALSIFAGLLGAVGVGIVAALYVIPTSRLPFYARLLEVLESQPKLAKVRNLFASSHEVMAMLQSRGAQRGRLAFMSIALWCLHLAQIYCFFLALNAAVPPLALWSLMPLAIFIGLAPISLFGLGTRDAAIIFLFAPWHPPAILAGVGFYVSLRYFVPALAGLPFLHRYMAVKAQAKGTQTSR